MRTHFRDEARAFPGTPGPQMGTVATICQTLAIVFLCMNLAARPDRWRRYLVIFFALAVVIAVGSALDGETPRAIVLFGGVALVFVGVRVYDAKRPNRSRTRR